MVDRLVFEDRGYILDRKEDVGGRGVNASCVLHSFGARTLAILTAGGEAGANVATYILKRGFPSEIVTVAAGSRTNLTISDRQGLTIKLNEFGAPLTSEELEKIRFAVEKWTPEASWLMLCGSLPESVPAHFYRELIEMASAKGVKTLLDTDGDALLHGIEAGPTAVTPNQAEAERLLNRALITRGQFLDAAHRIHGMGAQSVVLSLGSRGAIGVNQEETIEAIPPRVDALCPIGAGDALAAAFVWALDRKKPFADAVRWGVAAGTASATLPGMAMADLQQTMAMLRRVELRRSAG